MVKSSGNKRSYTGFYLLVNSEISILEKKNLIVLEAKVLIWTNLAQEAYICRQIKQTVFEKNSP
jgi:hypothetical protein